MKRKLKNLITAITDNISLRAKILLMFLLFFALPIFIFTLISYFRTNTLIRNQTINSMNQTYNESMLIINRYFKSMENAMQTIVSETDIHQAAYMISEEKSIFEQHKYYMSITTQFNFIQTMSDIDFVRLYTMGSPNYPWNDINILSFSNASSMDWYKKLWQNNLGRFWVVPNYITDSQGNKSNYFSYLGMLYAPDDFTKTVGMLRIDIDKAKIDKALESLKFTKDVIVFLSSGENILYELPDNPKKDIPKDFILNAGKFEDWTDDKLNNTSYFVRSSKNNISGWNLTVMFPKNEIFIEQNKLYRDLLVTMLVIIVISATLSYFTIRSALKRISKLNKEIKQIEKGTLNTDFPARGNDEIGELMKSFNYMTKKMSEMIKESYIMGETVKNAELHALQAQINPHFLYNSLDLINCVAIQRDVPEIIDMVNALVEFYKLSLSNGKEIISLKDELSHVKMYVKIQNLRFEKEIILNSNEEEWLCKYCIPKIILQPIVENAIMHGILEKDDENAGIIDINFKKNKDDIIINVSDNGIGMNNEMINSTLHLDSKNKKSGYGIQNINDRLSVFFGPEYGISIKSEINIGTTVTVRIPKIEG